MDHVNLPQVVALPSPAAAISVKELALSFGKTEVLKGLTLEAPVGCIYGLLGPSGCGKTSLIRCIVGVLKNFTGTLRVLGQQPGSPDSLIPGSAVGYMPQDVTLFDDLSIKETLQYFGALFGMSSDQVNERSSFLVKFLDLPEEKRLVRNLSGGQKRRVSLASALIHKPPLLILDEPTVGVDPLLRRSIWTHLGELVEKEQLTVLITTHYIEEAKDANRVGLMRDGIMLAEDTPALLLERYNRRSLEAVFLHLCNQVEEKEQSTRDGIPEAVLSPPPPSRCISSSSLSTASCSSSLEDVDSQAVVIRPSTPPPPTAPPTAPLSRATRHAKPVSWYTQVSAMVGKNVNTIVRNKWLLAFNFMLPTLEVILFCACIGLNLHSIDVAVYDGDQSAMSQSFVSSLSPIVMKVKMYSSAEDAIAAVRSGGAAAALTMYGNFSFCLIERMTNWNGEVDSQSLYNSTLHLYPDMSNQLMVMAIQAEVTRVFIQVGKQFLDTFGANPAILEMPIKMEEPIYGLANPIYRDYMAPGTILSIAFLSAIPLTAMVLVVERKNGLIERSMVAGTSYTRIMVALLLPQVVLLFFSSLALMIFVFPIFGIPYHGEFLLIALLTFVQSICGMCFGLFVSTLAKDENTATMMALGFFYPNLLLSGTVWPVEAMSDWVQSFSLYLPQTMAIGSMRHMIARGWSLYHSEVICGFAATALWSGIFLVASVVAYKYGRKF